MARQQSTPLVVVRATVCFACARASKLPLAVVARQQAGAFFAAACCCNEVRTTLIRRELARLLTTACDARSAALQHSIALCTLRRPSLSDRRWRRRRARDRSFARSVRTRGAARLFCSSHVYKQRAIESARAFGGGGGGWSCGSRRAHFTSCWIVYEPARARLRPLNPTTASEQLIRVLLH